MASWSLSVDKKVVTINVTGLSSGDSVRIYMRYADDPSASILDQSYTATGSTMSKSYTLSTGEYAANVQVNSAGWLGGIWFTIGEDRPQNWTWTGIYQGAPISNLTYTQWNGFCNRINAFRKYKSIYEYSFTTVASGTKITAAIVNEAWYAINGISGHGTLPSLVSVGDKITASFFTQLATALNAIS